MTDTWCCDTCRNLAEAANPLTPADDGECICLEPGDAWGCGIHPTASSTTKCGKCGERVEDIFVVVCRHVLEGDFDYDDNSEQVPRIRRTVPLMSKPGPTVHRCDDDTCPQTELCGDCWGDT